MARCIVGDPETAITDAERAMRLSPLDTSKWVANEVLATAYMQLERYEEAADRARQSVRQHIFNAPAHHALAASCAHLGRIDEAREAVRHALEIDPEMSITRLQEIYQVARYKNLDGFLSGLRLAGMPE